MRIANGSSLILPAKGCVTSMNKTDLLEYLKETSSEMTRDNIDEAVLLHFDLVMESYREKPSFYKNLLKLLAKTRDTLPP